jgi:2-dehydro-3-deoxygalactonokinase
MQAEWVAVDWGTSNLRAWGIGPDGATVFARQSDRGMGRLTQADYPATLADLVGANVKDGNGGTDVVICGMAGARQGWLEAPYLDAPADLGGLAFGAVSPEMPDRRLRPRILPGICQKTSGAEDVMRGEETQLLGLSALKPGFAGLVVMPGTHSKWVRLDGSRVERFSTAMTGELYEVLRQHSVLRHSLTGDLDGAERDDGYTAGLTLGIEAPERLTATLFKVRAGSLLSGRGPAWSAGFLSGLLIGAEIGGQRDWLDDTEIPLIGGTNLCSLYAQGFAMVGARTAIIDAAEATLAGLKAARSEALT